MCLTIDEQVTKKFLEKNKNKKEVVVWKIIKLWEEGIHSPNKYVTPYFAAAINAGWFKTKGKLERSKSFVFPGRTYIGGGTIHVFTNRRAARLERKLIKGKIIKCKALVKDFVAAGMDNDLCFKKIWISKEELK